MKVTLLVGLAVAAGLLVTMLVVNQFVIAQSNTSNMQEGTMHKVRAGAGGPRMPLTTYKPQSLEINVGDSVTWYNASNVADPHTITLVLDSNYRTDLDTPFLISQGSNITPIPNTNTEPLIIQGQNGQNMLIGVNARAFNPVVIGSDGSVTPLTINATYTVKGDEKYINSGFLWPKNNVPEGLPPNTTFTLTFEKSGVYNYYCIIHPWQVGNIIVR
jgi:plastocyanin